MAKDEYEEVGKGKGGVTENGRREIAGAAMMPSRRKGRQAQAAFIHHNPKKYFALRLFPSKPGE